MASAGEGLATVCKKTMEYHQVKQRKLQLTDADIHLSADNVHILRYSLKHTASYSLPEYLRDPTLSVDTFRRYLKTYFFARY